MRKHMPCLALVLLLALIAFVMWFAQRRASFHLTRCQSQLRSIGAVIALYAEYHEGQFPPHMSDLLSWNRMSEEVFKCPPNSVDRHGAGATLEESSDYLYVYWPDGMSTPGEYPVLYDRRLSNHGGQGINVLLRAGVGHPKGDFLPVVWDQNASWLFSFARRNPGHGIPLPEDANQMNGEERARPSPRGKSREE
jgi:hypothetical protein